MATKSQGGLPASVTKAKPVYGQTTEEDDDVDAAMRRVMDAYTARQNRGYNPGLMAIAQGLLSSKGSFGEAAGMAAKNYQDVQGQLRQEDLETAQAELQLTQAKRDQALVRRRMAGTAKMLTSGSGAIENAPVDPDAFNQLVISGADPETAMQILSTPVAAPRKQNIVTPEGIAEYVSMFGSNAESDTAIKLLMAQDSAYEFKDGLLINKRDKTAIRIVPVGLPAAGEDSRLTATIGGEILMDSRSRLLYNNAASKGEENANKFVEDYKKFGVAPAWAEKAYSTGPIRPEVDAGQLSVSLQTLAGKTNSLKNASPDELKKIRFTPAETKILGALNRITAAQGNVDNLSPYDKQVLSIAQGLMGRQEPVNLNGSVGTLSLGDVQAAAPKAAVPAPLVAAAPSPAPDAAPAAKAAASSAVAPAPAALVAATAPVVKADVPSVDGLPPAPKRKPYPKLPSGVLSTQQKTEYENSVKEIDKQYEADLAAWKAKYGTQEADRARRLQRESNVEEAGGEDRIKEAQKREFAVPEKLSLAKSTKYAALDVMKRVSDSPEAFGLLEYPGIIPAILTIASEGARVGDTSVTIAGLQSAIAKASPGMSETALIDRTLANKRLAELQLMYAKKDMAGQGAISDKERALAEAIAGSVNDNPLALTRRMMLLVERSDFEQKELEAFRSWRKKNPVSTKKDYFDFQESDELASVRKDYDKKMDSLYAQFFGKAEAKAASGATTGSADANRVRAQKEINKILGVK